MQNFHNFVTTLKNGCDYHIDRYFRGENVSFVKFSSGQIFMAESTHENLTLLKFDTAKI